MGRQELVFSIIQVISRTTGPNIDLFVLILMHFPCWFQIWAEFFNNSEIFLKTFLTKFRGGIRHPLGGSMYQLNGIFYFKNTLPLYACFFRISQRVCDCNGIAFLFGGKYIFFHAHSVVCNVLLNLFKINQNSAHAFRKKCMPCKYRR